MLSTEIVQLIQEHDRTREALLEGEICPDQEKHLAECPICQGLKARLARLEAMTPRIPPPRRGLLAELMLVTQGIPRPRPGLLEDLLRVTRGQGRDVGRDDDHDQAVEDVASDVAPAETVDEAAEPAHFRSSFGLRPAFLTQGEPLPPGRVGTRRGELTPGTPRSGLGPHVERLVTRLRLPGPAGSDRPVEVWLDPLRSPLDRRRYVALHQLDACGVPYGRPARALGSGSGEQLTERWSVRWTAATAAMLELAAVHGATLPQAAEGTLRRRIAAAERAGGAGSRLLLDGLSASAAGGLGALAFDLLRRLRAELPRQASLPEMIEALELGDRLERGHEPGWRPDAGAIAELRAAALELEDAAVRQIEGIAGSNRTEDAGALLAVVRRFGQGGAAAERLGGERLRWSLARMADRGSPLMQGAAGAGRVLLGHAEAGEFAIRLASWVDAAGPGAQPALAARLKGALLAAAPLLEASADITAPLVTRIDGLDDREFLLRLPALREAFEVLSPAARERFLGTVRGAHDLELDLRLDHAAALLARWADANRARTPAAGKLLGEET